MMCFFCGAYLLVFCAGEHIYSQPLIDDIDGDGFLDFLIGTMNGQMLLFETAVPANVLNSWNSFPKNRLNGFTHADKGIVISGAEKNRLKLLDIHGRWFKSGFKSMIIVV